MLFACGFTAYVHGGGSRELVGISATTPELTGKANFPHDLENSDLKGQCVVCAEENNFLNFDQNIFEKISHARRNMPIKRARETRKNIGQCQGNLYSTQSFFYIFLFLVVIFLER